MRDISKEELSLILDKHAKWLKDEDGGEKADLRYADLSYADLSFANLRYTNLSYTNLRYANLNYADLSAANLSAADLRYSTHQYYITQRSDGYQFFLVLDKGGSWMIRAGCRYKSIESYRDHLRTYSSEEKKTETTLILDFAEAKLNAITEKKENAA